jgi:hypothetical protein
MIVDESMARSKALGRRGVAAVKIPKDVLQLIIRTSNGLYRYDTGVNQRIFP